MSYNRYFLLNLIIIIRRNIYAKLFVFMIYNKYICNLKQTNMKQIPNYPNYCINEDGTILVNIITNRQLKMQCQIIKGKESGYKTYSIQKPDKYQHYPIGAHRLVAFTYLPPPLVNQVWINHKDGNKANNHYTNLEWTTISENIKHSFDVLGRKAKKGPENHLYGTKAKESTKKLMSEAKKGAKHPKFKGLYIVHHLKYYSANEAAKATGENAKTIIRKCKKGDQHSEYYFVSVR